MVIATAERHIQIYNLSNPSTPFKVNISKIYYRLYNHRLNGKQELLLVFLVLMVLL